MSERDWQLSDFQDFTEDGFRTLLKALARGGYRFAAYGDAADDRHVIWRHDIDMSVHRAARLAQIEAEEGAFATYLVNPRCDFYNVLEPAISDLLRGIRDLGHEIGLHFDSTRFGDTTWTRTTLVATLKKEKALLETILEHPVRVVSWHNPSLSNLMDFEDEEIGGLCSAYSGPLRRDYTYCSDSNGYWRFRPMGEVIGEGHEKLHLLTHPVWWTPEVMTPSDRIDRAIQGRADRIRADYDHILGRSGRENVGSGINGTR
ncbi:hypothetical protein [Minwuia sp.]|uniref:hypothetical protein n=1 Tax=Minwuia sp. TaxID=2493630 RepID=UPI003A93977B